MNWEQLICAERQQKKPSREETMGRAWETAAKRGKLDEFDDDYLSIISSQAFAGFRIKHRYFRWTRAILSARA